MDFSPSFYTYKRTVLLFASIALLFCAPSIETSNLSILGISFSGIPFATLTTLLFLAATYYFSLFATSAYVEAKTNLLSHDNKVTDVRSLLEASLQRLDKSIEDFQPVLQSTAMTFDHHRFPHVIKGMEGIVSNGKLAVTFERDVVPAALGNVSVSSFNAISGWFTEQKRKASQNNERPLPDELRVVVTEALRSDIAKMAERAAQQALAQSWLPLRNNLTAANASMDEHLKNFREAVEQHQSTLSSYRKPLQHALVEIKLLGSIRSIRYWALEVGIVALTYGVALAHFIGTHIRVFPSWIFY